MKAKVSGWQDSLLNARNWKFANEALNNLRISCCGSLQILPSITNKNWSETLEILREKHNVDDLSIQVVNNFIYRCINAELSGCQKCGIQLQTLFVICCGHLVCPECISNEMTSCPICFSPFDADEFQRLQPGIDFQFCLNLEEEKKDRESKRSLSRALAVSPPSNNDEVIYLDEIEERVADERQAALRRHKKGEGCEYKREFNDGKCTICKEEHFDCNFLNDEQRCHVCYKYAEEVPEYASKAKYVVDKLIELRKIFQEPVPPTATRLFAKRNEPNSSRRRPVKAVVFSQFRSIYEYFGNRLIRRFGGACVADFSYGGTRSQELAKFIHDPQCFVMLLSKQGSLGLDLSFVTHLFFLDTIYDKSLENQVVARAYRMGASGPVYVEQLTAKKTIEEVMQQLNEDRQSHNSDQTEKHAKMHLLLKRCQLVRRQKVQMNSRMKRNAQDIDAEGKMRQQRSVRFKD
jgi:SNF2 family DNA or RNA helicase